MSASKLSNSGSSFCLIITALVLVTFMLIDCSARPDRSDTLHGHHHHHHPQPIKPSARTNAPLIPLNKERHEVAAQLEVEFEDNCSEAARERRQGQSEETEDECLMKRSLMAHLDYIYTQNHTN